MSQVKLNCFSFLFFTLQWHMCEFPRNECSSLWLHFQPTALFMVETAFLRRVPYWGGWRDIRKRGPKEGHILNH